MKREHLSDKQQSSELKLAPSHVRLPVINYSYLKASIGFNLDAFAAGKMPNSTPTAPENPSARSVAQSGTLAGGKSGMPLEISTPRP